LATIRRSCVIISILNFLGGSVITGVSKNPGVEQAPAAHFASPEAHSSTRMALLFVALTATAVISPFFLFGNASGHDIQFHLSSWMDVSRQWREGIIFPRWCEWANWGFGEPRYIFYPPVSWVLGGALGSVLPWRMVPGAVIWVALVLAGMSMWFLAREWFSPTAAIAAAVLFAADPYHLVMLYYRSDFAELLGAALLPLLFWTAIHVARGGKHFVSALALVFAGIWLCNDPVGVIATYSLALALVVACFLRRSLRPLLLGGAGMAAGFALIAFYLFPAAYEQHWVQINGALSPSLQPAHNFLFARDNEQGFLEFNMRTTRVAMSMIAATLVAGVLFARRRRGVSELWSILLAAAVSSSFIMFSPSLIFWRLMPKLAFVQFPWRWMDMLAVPLALFVTGAAVSFRKRWAFWLVVALAAGYVGAVATTIIEDGWWDDRDAVYLTRGIEAAHGFDGTDEYAPLGVSHWDLPGEPADVDDKEADPPPETPRIEMVSDESGEVVPAAGVSVKFEKWTAERRIFSVKAANDVSLVVRLLNYPAWEVRIDGAHVSPGYADVTGQMVLPVTQGTHLIDIRFRRTWDRTLGLIISLIAAIALMLFAWRLPRQRE
jgi:6-pyruvoyl-tetrahydropterin synthase-like protein